MKKKERSSVIKGRKGENNSYIRVKRRNGRVINYNATIHTRADSIIKNAYKKLNGKETRSA